MQPRWRLDLTTTVAEIAPHAHHPRTPALQSLPSTNLLLGTNLTLHPRVRPPHRHPCASSSTSTAGSFVAILPTAAPLQPLVRLPTTACPWIRLYACSARAEALVLTTGVPSKVHPTTRESALSTAHIGAMGRRIHRRACQYPRQWFLLSRPPLQALF